MNIELIVFTQVASIIGYISALFIIYRVLVKQKDSTIELLKEKNSFLELRLAEAKSQTPDQLVENISKRVKLLNEELERLNQDKEENELVISAKEGELHSSQKELNTLRRQFERAEELMSEFFCSECKAPMVSRAFAFETVEYNGREIDVDHEHVLYECGLEYIDGKEESKCGSL